MKAAPILATLSVLASTVLAAPARLVSRQNINANGTSAGGVSDVDVLQFALTLEYLELNLYETVVTKYDNSAFEKAGFTANDRSTFLQIITEEQMHIAALQKNVKMLGNTPTQPCTYDYGNASSLNELLNVTDAVNGLGPSAYLGAGAFIQSKLLLTEGASIGNIETRHNSWLNGLLGRSEVPTAFQLPLSPTQSYAVASQFIVSGSCPDSNPPLKAVTAYPPGLTITNPGYPAKPLQAGATVNLKVGGGKKVNAPRVAFLYSFNTTIVDLDSGSMSAQIPKDTGGQAYAVLTTAKQGDILNDANSLSGPAAFYVDVPAQNFQNVKVTTYDFLPGYGSP